MIWKKKDLESLSITQKDEWFDVYNDGLLDDRGYNLKEMTAQEINKVNKVIKEDYFNYLKSLKKNPNFICYILIYDSRIISQARLVKDKGNVFIEGLQTHREFVKQGLATKVLTKAIEYARNNGITVLNSTIRKWNQASIITHEKLNFKLVKIIGNDCLYQLHIQNSKTHFNDWADKYNEDVTKSNLEGTYPFSGYDEIQALIEAYCKDKSLKILEMGVGTGEMTKKLYNQNHVVTGVDFSREMIQIAKKIMPNAEFIESDFFSSLSLIKPNYDIIIFSYSIHHLRYDDQLLLLKKLDKFLHKNGLIIIGDVMTSTKLEMQQLKKQYSPIWDDEEFYPMEELYKDKMMEVYDISFHKVSHCSGVVILKK